MTSNGMTFNESYGWLPTSTFRLVRKHNVSPADFDYMTDVLGMEAWQEPGDGCNVGHADWSVIEDHIVRNSPDGYYNPRYF